jgi:hypothetical protein
MLAPVTVINPRVMNRQYPEKEQRQQRKFAPRKSKQEKRSPHADDGLHIDITA